MKIQRIETVGKPADPERMTVVEVVDAPDLEPGTVVDELRRGYAWRGRVFREAEVRAVSQVREGLQPNNGAEENGNDHRD